MKTTHIDNEDLYLIQTAAGHREFTAGHGEAATVALDWRWSKINHGLITISNRGHVVETFVSAIVEETIRRKVSPFRPCTPS